MADARGAEVKTMAMLGKDKLSQLLRQHPPEDDGGIVHSSPLYSSPDVLNKQRDSTNTLREEAESGRLFDTGPHRKQYEEVTEGLGGLLRDFVRCFRVRLLAHPLLMAAALVSAWTFPELAAYRTWIVVGSIVASILFLVATFVRADPTDVYCPECTHWSITFAFPYVRPCVHCGTPTCHIKGKPVYCLHCEYPMIPGKPTEEEKLYSVKPRPENCVHARCTGCGKLQYVRHDIVGGCH